MTLDDRERDYDTYVKFEKEIVVEMFEEMKEFISEIKKLLITS